MAKVDAADGESAAFPAPTQQGPVEARSLSSITSIASNPPNYPRNPAQKKLDPLELYIVRVPGSKDVFLTPLKPPTKSSVSAEAINASLYYLHVAGPEDDALLQEYEQEREERARLRKEGLIDDEDMTLPPAEIARLNNVRRKPISGVQDAPTLNPRPKSLRRRPVGSQTPGQKSENGPPSPLVTEQTASPVLPLRPALLDAPNPAGATARTPTAEEYRPPMPPRPLPGVPQLETPLANPALPRPNNRWSALSGNISSHIHRERERQEAAQARHSFDAPRLPMRPSSLHDLPPPYSPTTRPPKSPGQSPTRRPRDVHSPPPPPPHPPPPPPKPQPGFHITLIRRDPSHGSQWNVATMSTPQLDGTGIDIDVSTPGYSRFVGKNEPINLDSLGLNLPAEARSLLSRHPNIASLSDSPATPSDASTSRDPSQPRRFHRKLLVSRPHNPDESRGSLDLSGGRPSIDSIPASPGNPHQSTSSKLKSGYYTFTSPWNGTCTFSASVNGRSLKCKHMIPSPGGFPNPSHENPAVTVAEIRFNTPFQTGHLQYPGSSHASPFHLSQTTILRDPSANYDPSAPYYYDPSIPPPSKRAAIAHLINQKLNRRSSNSSSSDGGGNDPPPPPPLPGRHPPDEDRIDLSLAREKAGGGMRGDSAKLGKLIIEDEGIKMLDLVVAACMAVWWRGYYY
ncbi:uncharacterized protein BDV17DRAFT_289575 [Aspergillus undulatus]|uniref:uncharacterized protein n=1 Tax=Aspergillus undulatus TaxID=1810928 RepID=UPI003CCE16E0